jgi:hypothetical protein
LPPADQAATGVVSTGQAPNAGAAGAIR